MHKNYDYIITGAGCAGLSLAYRLTRSGLAPRRVLLLDQAPKNQNDRTWCFWEEENHWYQPLVSKSWSKLFFYGNGYDQLMDISPFRYKMIRGIDFYRFILERLEACPSIEFKIETIHKIHSGQNTGQVQVITDQGSYQANMVFNSLLFRDLRQTRHNYIDQHFKGWVIRTQEDIFDPDKATLMDFRIPQCGETRFIYLLPENTRTAMIEATVFSNKLLQSSEYDKIIKEYINNYLKASSYEILHQEQGIIPMTDQLFNQHQAPNVVPIGKAAGRVKPSSGYAFLRIQQQIDGIISALERGNYPTVANTNWRFRLYDSILLNVMLNDRAASAEVFGRLFRNNQPAKVLAFLNEETSFAEDLAIITACPWIPFLKALGSEIANKFRRELTPYAHS